MFKTSWTESDDSKFSLFCAHVKWVCTHNLSITSKAQVERDALKMTMNHLPDSTTYLNPYIMKEKFQTKTKLLFFFCVFLNLHFALSLSRDGTSFSIFVTSLCVERISSQRKLLLFLFYPQTCSVPNMCIKTRKWLQIFSFEERKKIKEQSVNWDKNVRWADEKVLKMCQTRCIYTKIYDAGR